MKNNAKYIIPDHLKGHYERVMSWVPPLDTEGYPSGKPSKRLNPLGKALKALLRKVGPSNKTLTERQGVQSEGQGPTLSKLSVPSVFQSVQSVFSAKKTHRGWAKAKSLPRGGLGLPGGGTKWTFKKALVKITSGVAGWTPPRWRNLQKALVIILALIILLPSLAYLSLRRPQGAEAAWFDDNCGYRQRADTRPAVPRRELCSPSGVVIAKGRQTSPKRCTTGGHQLRLCLPRPAQRNWGAE